MRETVTISMTNEMKSKLDEVAKNESLNRSEVIKTALNQYFSVVEFRKIRNSLIPKAQEAKVFSEDDVYKLIS